DVSVAPSASAFVSLRRLAGRTAAKGTDLIGFGDPLLGRYAPHSQASARSIVFPEAESIHANLAPLPDTRVELTAMARAIHATAAPIYFGAEATEAHVKSVDLARYRIVVFATHGLLRDDERGVTEP